VKREFASPAIANLLAARVPPEEFERRVRAPITEAEARDVAELVEWFTRRYPTAKERFAYARRKLRQYAEAQAPLPAAGYLTVARRLAAAHRATDPSTELVFLDADPEQEEIRLVEVTRSAASGGELHPIGFAARPDLGFPFPSQIVLMGPSDWAAVEAGRLELPDGWSRTRLLAL
jgi:hypothetical protein